MIDATIRTLLEAGKVEEARALVRARQEETLPEDTVHRSSLPNYFPVLSAGQRKAAEDARIAQAQAEFLNKSKSGKGKGNMSNRKDIPSVVTVAPAMTVIPAVAKPVVVPKIRLTEDDIRKAWGKRLRAGEVSRTAALAGIDKDLRAHGWRRDPSEPEVREELPEIPVEMLNMAAEVKPEKMVELRYHKPDVVEGVRVLRMSVEKSAVARTATQLILDGTTRGVMLERGVILTLIHRDERGAEYAVQRKWYESEGKAQEAGQKALAEGLPRRKMCPNCRGLGRVWACGSTPCPDCLRPCSEKTCGGPECKRCDGGGEYGCGQVDDEPLMVHAFWSGPELRAQMVVGRHEGRLIDRGVLALDKPLPVDKPKRKAESSGGKSSNRHPQWQKVGQTRVTFSKG